MAISESIEASVRHPDRFFIGGEWVKPSSDAVFEVVDSTNEQVFLTVAEAKEADMSRAVAAARQAFDDGPWPRMSHSERAGYLRAIADGLRERAADLAQIWTRETGVLFSLAQHVAEGAATRFEYFAGLAESYLWEEPVAIADRFAIVVQEPVGVVGAILPWNGPLPLSALKLPPALLAGCTVVLKSSPEAPAEAYVLAEVAESVGLPPGVLNVVTADREVSELLVRDQRVDKITFTGSTAAGRRIGSICGERIARCSLELGGKSAAVILDDFDVEEAASTLAAAECFHSGQVCLSVTRVLVPRHRHDEMAEALASAFGAVRVGDPFEPTSGMGPLVSERQRERVEGFISKGKADGAKLAVGGGRPAHLERGYYVEPTLFVSVDNSSTIGQEEIFGPVLSVIPVESEEHAIKVANDSIYGLNASVFTNDVDRARHFAREIRSGTVAQNTVWMSGGLPFGGFKQSGIGREGTADSLRMFLETKSVVLSGQPSD